MPLEVIREVLRNACCIMHVFFYYLSFNYLYKHYLLLSSR